MSTSDFNKVTTSSGRNWLKLLGVLIVLAVLITALWWYAVPETKVAAPVPMSTKGTLELWEYDYPSQGSGHREWIVHCIIPVPVMTSSSSEVAVRMDSNGYGCKNDEAEGFRLVGTASGITVGFFDSKCDDAGRYNDDNYQYNIMSPDKTFGPYSSFQPAVPPDSVVANGLIYWFGKTVNGIAGKLSCVSFWPHSNAGGISGS